MSCITYFNNDPSGLQVYVSGYTCLGIFTAVTLNYLQGICMDDDYDIITCGNADIGAPCIPAVTPSVTPTISLTPSITNSSTPTPTLTNTPTPSVTTGLTPTPTPNETSTPTPTITQTRTPNVTSTPTGTPNVTSTPTGTASVTQTPTSTLPLTPTPTPTITNTPSISPTNTPTASASGLCECVDGAVFEVDTTGLVTWTFCDNTTESQTMPIGPNATFGGCIKRGSVIGPVSGVIYGECC